MKFISIFLIIAVFCAPVIKSSNILVFLPSPWKSHVLAFKPLFLELANRGHNLTVVTQFPVENPPPNYQQVILNYELDTAINSETIIQERNKYLYFLWETVYIRSIFAFDITKMYIASQDLQKFIKEDQSTFDLVIVESFFQECTIAIGHKYNAPVISIIPVAPWSSPSSWAANPMDVSYIKDFIINAGKSMDFRERLINTFIGMYSTFIEPILYIPKMENMMNEYFQYPGYENRPSLPEMLKNISLSLIDSDLMILSPRPYVPSFIEVPGIHLQPLKEIDKELQVFMDRANTGFVYFNYGTLMDPKYLPNSSLTIMFDVLGRLEQKVIFKWKKNETQGLPDNFYVDSWLPQREILKHPNCKLFITHGGIHGLMEAIDAAVPVLGFPIFGDQFMNLRASQDNGIGIMSDIFTLNEDNFKRDVNLILTEKRFAENAKRMSKIFLDRPMTSLDKAVYWVEYVIRHKGAHHLRSAAMDLKWYQFYSLDVIALIVSIMLLLMCICYLFTKWIVKSLINLLFKRNKVKSA